MGTASFNPFNPQDTEPAREGASWLRTVNQNILVVFGFSGTQLNSAQSFPSPFIVDTTTGLLTVVADPTAALGIATKQYVDAAHVSPIAVIGTDNYTPSGTGVTAYRQDTIYLVHNTGATNTGTGVMLNLGAGSLRLLKRDAATNLATGDFPAGWYMVSFNGTDFVLLDFFGGTLQADPTQDLGAATKQYVDNIANAIVRPTLFTAITETSISAGKAALITSGVSLVIPSDGEYAIYAEYAVWDADPVDLGFMWVEDDQGHQWAQTQNLPTVACVMSGSGLSPTRYTAGATVVVNLYGGFEASIGLELTHSSEGLTVTSGLNLTLVRAHS